MLDWTGPDWTAAVLVVFLLCVSSSGTAYAAFPSGNLEQSFSISPSSLAPLSSPPSPPRSFASRACLHSRRPVQVSSSPNRPSHLPSLHKEGSLSRIRTQSPCFRTLSPSVSKLDPYKRGLLLPYCSVLLHSNPTHGHVQLPGVSIQTGEATGD